MEDLETELALTKQVPSDRAIILWSLETVDEGMLHHAIKYMQAHGLADRTFWLLQPSHQYSKNLLDLLGQNAYQIDLDLLALNLHLTECKSSVLNHCWQADTGRFLFLTGKPNRPNRVRLLWKFSQAGLLGQADWSLFVDDHTRDPSRQYVPELDDIQFDQFATQHNRNLDGIEIHHCTAESNHSNGYPFDGQLYSRSSFRVISETMMMDKPIISEKTWITVANRMPFIMSGYPNNLEYLRESGYRTFENYLPVPEYDLIQDTEDRLDAVVENTKFWLDNIQNQKAEIAKDIEHNYQLLNHNIEKNIQAIKNLSAAIKEPDRSIYSLVPLGIEQYGWIAFYNSVKDPSWPDCLVEQNFKDLPIEIQHECITQFGYNPKNNH